MVSAIISAVIPFVPFTGDFAQTAQFGEVIILACKGSVAETLLAGVGAENLKSAMQWDLWNPWAAFYELNSTHPLIAHRLQYLADQAAAMNQTRYIVFDRHKPECYWDEFLVDLIVLFLPLIGLAER